MTGQEIGIILGALLPILTAIGAGFVWLINTIVKTSKTAVTELQRLLRKTEKERDQWRDRAIRSGWKEGQE